TAVKELKPMPVNWSAIYQSVTVPRMDVLAVEQVQPCAASTTPVAIDGRLDDWPNLPLGGEAYRFGVAHDERNVYVAVKVTDDKLLLNALKEPWSQDGVEIRLDARPDPPRSQDRGRGEFKD